jgi:hypothetical protein
MPEEAMQQILQEAVMNPPQPPSALELEPQYTLDEEAKKQLVQNVNDKLTRMKNFRRQFDRKRSEFYRQYLGQRDQALYPDNATKRSNTFVPYPYSNVETIVSRTMDAHFVYDPWFECKGRTNADAGAAENMQLVLEKKFKESKFIQHFEELVRNICIYGHGAMKIDWDWDYDHIISAEPIPAMLPNPQTGQLEPVVNPMNGQPVILGYQPVEKKVPRARPKFIPIDIYDLLIDPDGGVIAHMTERTFGQMMRESEQNPKLYYPEAMQELASRLASEKEPENVIIRMAEFWDELAGTCTLMTYGDDAEAISWKDLRFSHRTGNSYSSFRRKVYAGPPILLWHGENPFMHKRAPIVHTSYSKLPNEVYGIGAVESIADLTESLNRFVNMVTDNWNLGINRRYAYDVNADIDHEALNSFNVPGGKVAVNGDPSKVLKELPTHTPVAQDYMIVELYKGMIEMTSGVSDFYSKGVGSPTGNRTATGIANVINETNLRFKMFIRNLEVDVLQPILEMGAVMVQQFITDEVEVMLTDTPPGVPKFYQVPPEKLLGGLDFDLVAANYASNKVIKQRNLLALSNLIAGSPYVREREAILELAKVFEVRNIERFLKTDEEVSAEQQAMLQQQMQMMIFETMLQTESAARVAQARPRPAGAGQGKGGGRPRGVQQEGKIPGAGLSSAIRDFAQGMGANSLGLEGLGEISGA